MKTLLNKSRKRATVDVDGDTITIHELSLAESRAIKRDGEDDAMAGLRLIVASVIDPVTGVTVYADDDLPALQNAPASILRKLGAAIVDLNGLKSPNG